MSNYFQQPLFEDYVAYNAYVVRIEPEFFLGFRNVFYEHFSLFVHNILPT